MVLPQVTKAPLVAVLSTGDEVVEAGVASLPPGAIRDANRPMLLAAAAGAGAACMDLGIVRDSEGLPGLEAALHTAVDGGADVLITSGAALGSPTRQHTRTHACTHTYQRVHSLRPGAAYQSKRVDLVQAPCLQLEGDRKCCQTLLPYP